MPDKYPDVKDLFDSDRLIRFFRFIRDRFGLNKRVLLLFLSAIVGLIVAGLAILLTSGIELLSHLTYKNKTIQESEYRDLLFLMPMLGGLAVGLLVYLRNKDGQGGGVEETIKLIRLKRKPISLYDIILRFVTSIITLGTGGSAGKEGPVVHLGGGAGAWLGKTLRFPDSYIKTLAAAGVAAAIAAAFQAPIAGSFFALEILLASFALDTFSMIIVAAVTATAVSQVFQHHTHQLHIVTHVFENPINMIFFVAAGILGGFVTIVFIRSLHLSEDLFKKLPIPRWLMPAAGGLLMGGIAFFFPLVYSEGYNIMNLLLTGQFDSLVYYVPGIIGSSLALTLIVMLVVKIIATTATLGSGGSGGTIVPALFIGTNLGAILATVAGQLFPEIDIPHSTWVLVGMSSVLAPMTQAPIFSVMLFFELTQSYEVILPVLIVVTISTLLTRHFINGSLYSVSMEKQGIRLYQGMEQSVMETILVKEVAHSRINMIDQNVTLSTIINGFFHSHFTAGFVVNKDEMFLGVITLEQVKRFIKNESLCDLLLASEVAHEKNIWVTPDDNLMRALEIMDKTDLVFLPVISNTTDRKPVAYVTRKDIVSVYNRSVIKRGTQNILLDQDGQSSMNNYLQIGDEFKIETLQVPRPWINKTLKELDLRVKYNLTVVGIKKEEEISYIMPDIIYKFKKGDTITVVGKSEDLENLTALATSKSGFFNLLRDKLK
ncbi:MAG: chloride channel protein [Leptospirales bacterium]